MLLAERVIRCILVVPVHSFNCGRTFLEFLGEHVFAPFTPTFTEEINGSNTEPRDMGRVPGATYSSRFPTKRLHAQGKRLKSAPRDQFLACLWYT